MTWAGKYKWFAGLGIIVLTNAIALAGVAYNRSGEPDTVITLSERELRLPYSWRLERESSGLSLRLRWRINGSDDGRYDYLPHSSTPAWLDKEKLQELGFPVQDAAVIEENRRRLNRSLPREVYLVLEYNGAAYRNMLSQTQAYKDKQQALADQNPEDENILEEAKDARDRWERDLHETSRLFIVDAGLDPGALRSSYPDTSRNIIMRGNVQARVNSRVDDRWEVQGYIREITVSDINIPLAFRKTFDRFMKADHSNDNEAVRYQVTLAYGKRYEPWVVKVE
ncbi:MAG: DUF4824 family protein [Thiogranum sp.]|nr:DUF4824 family protein [Thiogranum sp.]